MAKLERRLTIISRKLPASVQRSGLTSFQTSRITLVEPLPWGQSCANRREDAIDRPSLRRCVTSRGGDEGRDIAIPALYHASGSERRQEFHVRSRHSYN